MIAIYLNSVLQGLRVPVEGVPNFNLFVFFISILFFLSFVVVLALVITFFNMLSTYLATYTENKIIQKLILIGLGIATAILLNIVSFWHGRIGGITGIFDSVFVLSSAAIFIALLILFVASKHVLIQSSIALVFALFFFSYVCILLFNEDSYSEILRVTRFGGGLNIEITCKENETHQYCNNDQVKLMLKTDRYIFVSQNKHYIEIPNDQIASISYPKQVVSLTDLIDALLFKKNAQ